MNYTPEEKLGVITSWLLLGYLRAELRTRYPDAYNYKGHWHRQVVLACLASIKPRHNQHISMQKLHKPTSYDLQY